MYVLMGNALKKSEFFCERTLQVHACIHIFKYVNIYMYIENDLCVYING